ncbi:MAG: hypothetical protein K5756_03130 [Clostridiales bacterium]|nr:hypothetical protein [Clostridiales bacterium]
MRPVKDLFVEEYWDIGFRPLDESDSVVNGGKQYDFKTVGADKRYWYADPFLFEKDGKTWLFVEMFDNTTELGVIGCSVFENGGFTKPRVVLEESFHLSYPYVFEKDGEIYMMPETHAQECIQLYRAVNFPDEWEKYKILVSNVDAVDTVINGDLLIASLICPEHDMTVDLAVYDFDGQGTSYNPVYSRRLDKRGAGRVFQHSGKTIRPAQNCENRVYGAGLRFYEITECSKEKYDEQLYSEISPENLKTGDPVPTGIHTYARSSGLEVVDIKFKRFNFKRLYWIARRALNR